MKIADLAANPPPEYRPVPFWSWNDRLENKELSRQIKAMYEAGIGGLQNISEKSGSPLPKTVFMMPNGSE